jgi:hypothetical protein
VDVADAAVDVEEEEASIDFLLERFQIGMLSEEYIVGMYGSPCVQSQLMNRGWLILEFFVVADFVLVLALALVVVATLVFHTTLLLSLSRNNSSALITRNNLFFLPLDCSPYSSFLLPPSFSSSSSSEGTS